MTHPSLRERIERQVDKFADFVGGYIDGAGTIDYEWLRKALADYRDEIVEETLKETIALADKLEASDTEFNEWRAFKSFRNALRDKLASLSK